MNNLFEPETTNTIIARIETLGPTDTPKWGKMNVSQMLAHCRASFEVYFGERQMKRGLMGILFGRMAKKKLFTDKPWSKGLPTAPEFIVKDERNFERERSLLVNIIRRFSQDTGEAGAVRSHPFFGKMTKKEWAMLGYKHLDHHLRQFGA